MSASMGVEVCSVSQHRASQSCHASGNKAWAALQDLKVKYPNMHLC